MCIAHKIISRVTTYQRRVKSEIFSPPPTGHVKDRPWFGVTIIQLIFSPVGYRFCCRNRTRDITRYMYSRCRCCRYYNIIAVCARKTREYKHSTYLSLFFIFCWCVPTSMVTTHSLSCSRSLHTRVSLHSLWI